MNTRRAIWLTLEKLRRAARELRGGRFLRVMDVELNLRPETEFPSTWRYPLPKEHWKHRIVRYGDFVQMHAVSQAASAVAGPVLAVDVGAYHGAYAVLLGKLIGATGGRVLAIEPNPDSYAVTCENIRRNHLEDVVIVENVAVAEHSGEVLLSPASSQTQVKLSGPAGQCDLRVKCERLDVLLARHGFSRVDLLMVDVEGAELGVLRGFPWETMACPKLFCEIHPNDWPAFSCTGEEFAAFLKEHGLRCFDTFMEEHRSFSGSNYLGPCLLASE